MEKDTKYIVRYITQDDGIRASGFLPELEVARYLQGITDAKTIQISEVAGLSEIQIKTIKLNK